MLPRQFAYTYGAGLPAGTKPSELAGLIWGFVCPISDINYGSNPSGPANMTLMFSPDHPESQLEPTIAACHAAGITCMLQVGASWGDSRNNLIFSSSTYMEQFLSSLAAIYAAHPALDGIEIDWESDEYLDTTPGQPTAALIQMHVDFYATLKARFPTKSIGTTQTWRWVTFTPVVENYVDHVSIMAYDVDASVGPWYSTLANVQTFVQRWLDAGFRADKLVLGISFAAYVNGPNGPSWSQSYRYIVDTYNPAPDLNAVGNYTYNGLSLVKAKAQYAAQAGLAGIFTYFLGFDKLGDLRSLTTTIYQVLSGSQPPPAAVVASFSLSPAIGNPPLTVQFSDRSTGTITSWVWDFGDGGQSNLQNPAHTYTTQGIYSVTLRVTGPGGQDTLTVQEAVVAMANVFPPGTVKTAKVPVTTDAESANQPFEMEVWLGPDKNTKVATSGKVSFTANGGQQTVNAAITMPSTGGSYTAFIDFFYQGVFVKGYVDIAPVGIIGAPGVGPIVWG